MASERFYLPSPVAFGSNGFALPGALANFYLAGTTTRTPIYTTAALDVEHSNPVAADAAGRFPSIFLDDAVTYRLVITDSAGGPIGVDDDPYVAPTTAVALSDAIAEAEAAAALTAADVVSASTAADRAEAASQYKVSIAYASYTELAAITGTDGQTAAVFGDAGTHTDPVVTGTVDNEGVYRYSVDPAGWERLANLEAADAATSADAAAASAVTATEAKNALLSVADAPVLVDDNFSDSDPLTTTNIQDGAAITRTITFNSDSMRIAQTTARTAAHRTHQSLATQRIAILLAQPVTLPTYSEIGFSMTDGTDRCYFRVTRTATETRLQWLNAKNGTPLTTLALGITPFGATDLVKFYLVSDPDSGFLTVHVSFAGGLPWAYRLPDVPFGNLELLQNNCTYDYSGKFDDLTPVEQEAVDAFQRYVEAQAAEAVTAIEKPALLADVTTLLALFEITPPAAVTAEMLQGEKFYTYNGKYSSSVDVQMPLSETDPEVLTVYCDTATGLDTNPGTEALPIRNAGLVDDRFGLGAKMILKARGDTDASTCIGSTGGLFAGVNGTIQVEAWGDGPFVSSKHFTGLTWTLESGTTWQTTVTGGASAVTDGKVRNAKGRRIMPFAAASLVECRATVGSYFISGTTVYVNLADGREPDSDVRVYRNLNAFDAYNFGCVGDGMTVATNNVRFEGGVYPCFIGATNAVKNITLRCKDTAFLYGGINGLSVNSSGTGQLQNCDADENKRDGFNYKSLALVGATPFYWVQEDCSGCDNGRDTQGTNNGCTSHFDCYGIDINPRHQRNQDRDVHHVDGITVWMLGGIVGPSTTDNASIVAGQTGADTAKIYVDGTVSANPVADLETFAVSSIFLRNFTPLAGVNIGAGTVEAY